MLECVLGDLACLPDVRLHTVSNAKQPSLEIANVTVERCAADPQTAILKLCQRCEAALIIAPETDHALFEVARLIETTGIALVGPESVVIGQFSDKYETARQLGQRAIPTTRWPEAPPGSDLLVVKPRDGAGTLHTAAGPRECLEVMGQAIRAQDYSGELIVQPCWPGLAASIAIVAVRQGDAVVLPGVRQFVETDLAGDFSWLRYAGGALPLPDALDERARALAKYVLASGAPLRGYVGIDIILGPAEDGSEDRLVEVNPRLTTSYIGYSRMTGGTIGALLLGRSIPKDSSNAPFGLVGRLPAEHIRFLPDGSVYSGIAGHQVSGNYRQ